MEINRFKQIIKYNKKNKAQMEAYLKDFYASVGMKADSELLNLLQITMDLFQKKGYIIVEFPFADKEIGALSYKRDWMGYTFLNTSLPKVNVNFALCHEIYHVCYQQKELKQKVELYMNEHYYEYEEEFAANLFASMLLMPEQNFRYMYHKFLNEAGEEAKKLSVLVKLMSYFGVPYMAALIRCYELDLLEAGGMLEELIHVDNQTIRDELRHLWLDENILNATKRDTYSLFEEFVAGYGEQFIQDGYLNERTVQRILSNMKVLYEKIKGE